MKEYIAKKTAKPTSVCDSVWNNIEPAALDCVWEDVFPSPYTTLARMVHSDEGIAVKMTSNEWPLRITATELNDTVCVDSCMEFFFTPNTEDKNYINIEINPAGISYVSLGEERHGRRKLDIRGEGIEIETLIRPLEGWELMLFVPYSFLGKYFSTVSDVFLGNFYKCGDKTVRQHYSTWNRVTTERPDYHRPECFGKIYLSL